MDKHILIADDELDVIEVNYKVNLNQMSKLLNIEQSQLKYLNPKY